MLPCPGQVLILSSAGRCHRGRVWGVEVMLGSGISEQRGDWTWLGLSIPAALQLPESTGDQSTGFQLETRFGFEVAVCSFGDR